MKPGKFKLSIVLALTIIGLTWNIPDKAADLSELIDPSQMASKKEESDVKIVKRNQTEFCPITLPAPDQKQEEEDNGIVILDLVTYSGN
jgi:hypothetical protein